MPTLLSPRDDDVYPALVGSRTMGGRVARARFVFIFLLSLSFARKKREIKEIGKTKERPKENFFKRRRRVALLPLVRARVLQAFDDGGVHSTATPGKGERRERGRLGRELFQGLSECHCVRVNVCAFKVMRNNAHSSKRFDRYLHPYPKKRRRLRERFARSIGLVSVVFRPSWREHVGSFFSFSGFIFFVLLIKP